MLQTSRQDWQISRHVLACVGLGLFGCGIVVSNTLFSNIPLWIARPALILLVGICLEIMVVALVGRYIPAGS
jgi:hypothetical protein